MTTQLIFSSNYSKWFSAYVIVLLIYLLIVVIYAENIPYGDDVAVLSSLYDILHESTWYLKFKTLFAFHNEHRIVVPRLVTILLYYCQFQRINIIGWIIVGNVAIFSILYLYFQTYSSTYKIKFFTPVLFFILQPIHYELMYWGMAALQNIGVLALSSLAFYKLSYSKNKFLPLFIAILAVFTSANGVFTFIIGSALLLYKKKWTEAIVWIIIGITSSLLYWIDYSTVVNSGNVLGESFHFIRFITTFISLSGGIVYTQSLPVLSLVLGSLLLVIITGIAYRNLVSKIGAYDKSGLFFLCCLAFILLTIAAVSLSRAPSNILSGSRYKLSSTLLISLTYMISIDRIEKRQSIFQAILSFAVLFWLVSYAYFTNRFDIHSRLLFSQFFNWKISGILDVHSPFAEKYYSDHLRKFYQAGQYVPPKKALEKLEEISVKLNGFVPISTPFSVVGQSILIDPVTLPVNEYYAVHKVQNKTTIYPLNTGKFYQTLFSAKAQYSTSVNASYWLKGSEAPLPIIALN